MRKQFVIAIWLVGAFFGGRAFVLGQDVHFSQPDKAPYLMNSALTGSFKEDYRVVFTSRSQWRSVTVPYSTTSFAFDTKINKRLMERDFIGLGGYVLSDKAGDGRMGTTAFVFNAAYTRALDAKEQHVFSLGGYLGMGQRSIDLSKLRFDNQFNGLQFDPNLGSGELAVREQFFYPDMGLGGNWRYHPSDDYLINTGLSYNHLLFANYSFLDNRQVKLLPRFAFYSYAQWNLTKDMAVYPKLYYQHQNAFHEWIVGMAAGMKLPADGERAFSFGIYHRLKDALILQIGMQYGGVELAFSYDATTSSLQSVNGGQGAWELALLYKFNDVKRNRIRGVPCYTF